MQALDPSRVRYMVNTVLGGLAGAAARNGWGMRVNEFTLSAKGGVPGVSDTLACALFLLDYYFELAKIGYVS
jgi:hypothetical protein